MDKINTAVFLKTAETLNFRKTADELGYTQAGVSYIISAMEEELGLPLFIREYGGVKLTSEGRALLPQFRELAAAERLDPRDPGAFPPGLPEHPGPSHLLR